MNYTEYFLKCRKVYDQTSESTLENFYDNPVIEVPVDDFHSSYKEAVFDVSDKVKIDLDREIQEGVMINHNNPWKFDNELTTICNQLVPFLEEYRFGCHLYVDKVYIYRTCKCDRSSSYLWHYDNNPKEVVKNIIYLNDVSDDNSPFEYLVNDKGLGIIVPPTRFGSAPGEGTAAPNNSRVTQSQIDALFSQGYNSERVCGPIGTTYSFSNDAVHRANPVVIGYRDVINIRVKPTLNKLSNYIDKKYTTSFETNGAVNPNPEVK